MPTIHCLFLGGKKVTVLLTFSTSLDKGSNKMRVTISHESKSTSPNKGYYEDEDN